MPTGISASKSSTIIGRTFLKNTSLQSEHFGKFDAVTFMDTVEHYITNEQVHRRTLGNTNEKTCEDAHQEYYDMFEFASKMIDKNSPRQKVFVSMLHLTETGRADSIFKYIAIPMMTRLYHGHYPPGFRCHCITGECRADFDEKPGQYHGLAKYSTRHFELTRIDDVTEDYRLTGVLNPKHFQSPVWEWDSKRFRKLLYKLAIDPFTTYTLLGRRWDLWMRLFGKNYTSPEYDAEFRWKNSWQICYWMTFKLK